MCCDYNMLRLLMAEKLLKDSMNELIIIKEKLNLVGEGFDLIPLPNIDSYMNKIISQLNRKMELYYDFVEEINQCNYRLLPVKYQLLYDNLIQESMIWSKLYEDCIEAKDVLLMGIKSVIV